MCQENGEGNEEYTVKGQEGVVGGGRTEDGVVLVDGTVWNRKGDDKDFIEGPAEGECDGEGG